jgi:hypothetical protein
MGWKTPQERIAFRKRIFGWKTPKERKYRNFDRESWGGKHPKNVHPKNMCLKNIRTSLEHGCLRGVFHP